MTDPSASFGQAGLVIPPEIQARFPELIALLLGSESMNTEERGYWINILPVMTPDQQKNLQDILQNEKSQLEAIDAKYAKEIENITPKSAANPSNEVQRKNREDRLNKENVNRAAEEQQAKNLLDQIEKAS